MATSHALKHTLTPSLWALIPVARTHNPSGPARFQTPYRCCWQTSRRCLDCQSHRSTLCHFLSSGQALSLPWPYRYTQKNKHKPSLLTLFFCCYKKKYLRNKEKTVVLVKVNMIQNILAEAKTLAASKTRWNTYRVVQVQKHFWHIVLMFVSDKKSWWTKS